MCWQTARYWQTDTDCIHWADDVGMRFGTDKCGILTMCRCKASKCEGITIASTEVIGEIGGNGYNLGIMEREIVARNKCKEVSRLNILNVSDQLSNQNILAIITLAAPTAWYGPAIMQWVKEELQQMDRETTEIITK